MRRRSRSRGSGNSNAVRLCCVTAILVVLVASFGGGISATAFTTGTTDRASSVDVVNDTDAALGIVPASSVHIDSTTVLVNTTNSLDRSADVTVALRSDSTACCDLYVDGTNEGDQTTLSLAPDETATVDVSVANDSSLVGQRVSFDVRASAPGLQVDATNRSVPIEE